MNVNRIRVTTEVIVLIPLETTSAAVKRALQVKTVKKILMNAIATPAVLKGRVSTHMEAIVVVVRLHLKGRVVRTTSGNFLQRHQSRHPKALAIKVKIHALFSFSFFLYKMFSAQFD